jgi:hypothetical protein
VAFALVPVVWVLWSSATPWMESEFYVAAEYNPADQKIYFVSTQEALVDDNPPAPPGRVKAEMWLERINLDGTGREKLVKVPTSDHVDVTGFPYRGGRYYATSRDVRLRFSPSRDKIAMEEYWGGVYVVSLQDKTVYTLISKTSTNEFRYDGAVPFIAWQPDDKSLLLLVTRHKDDSSPAQDVIVSTPAMQFQPEVLWAAPSAVAPAANGRYSHPTTEHHLTWIGTMGENLIVYDIPNGVHVFPSDIGHLALDKGRPMPINACWNIISGPQSNTWLTSEGDIVDEQLRVLKKLPDLHGEYSAERTPHAWYKDGIIITDRPVGLEIMNPDTGLTRTILQARLDHRSIIKDKPAYEAYRQGNIAWRKQYEENQRKEIEQYKKIKQDEEYVASLADGLNRHDTNALSRAKVFLGEDNGACTEAVYRLMAANWSEADDLVSAFILHGTNINCQCRAVQRISNYYPDRFSNTLVQIASESSSNNTRMLLAALPGLGMIHGSPADSCLANVAVKCPDFTTRDEALIILRRRNRTIYSQTMQQLADDKEFMEYYSGKYSRATIPKR